MMVLKITLVEVIRKSGGSVRGVGVNGNQVLIIEHFVGMAALNAADRILPYLNKHYIIIVQRFLKILRVDL